MNVRVRLLGVFRGSTGKDQLLLTLERATVREAIQALIERLPTEIGAMLINPEFKDPQPNALVLLNGREINVLNGLETVVSDGDEVTLVPVAHGG